MRIRELLGYCAGMGETERVEGSNLNGWADRVRKGIEEKHPDLYIVGSGSELLKEGQYQKVVAHVCHGPLSYIDLTQASEEGIMSLSVVLKSSRYANLFADREIVSGTSGTHVFSSHKPYEGPYDYYLSSDDAVDALTAKDLSDDEISEMMMFVSEEGSSS